MRAGGAGEANDTAFIELKVTRGGAPASGVRYSVTETTQPGEHFEIAGEVLGATDAFGAARFGVKSKRSLWLVVKDPLSGDLETQLAPLASAETRAVSVALAVGGTVKVRVVDHLDNPLIGAGVACFEVKGNQETGVVRTGTNRHGVAMMAGLKPGIYRIVCTGWNASGADFYLISRVLTLNEHSVHDIGTVRGRKPNATLTLLLDKNDASARLVHATIVSHNRPKMVDGVFETDLPLNRPFRMWTGSSGRWNLNMNVREPGSRTYDTKIPGKAVEVFVPGTVEIEFAPHEPAPRAVATVRLVHPEPGKRDGFVAMMFGDRVVSMYHVTADAELSLSFVSPYEGQHRIIGAVGPYSIDQTHELRHGDQMDLGNVHYVPDAVMCEVTGTWHGGGTIESAAVRVFVGSGGLGDGRMQALEFAMEDGLGRVHLPPALEVELECQDGAKQGAWTVPPSAPGEKAVVMNLRDEEIR